MKETLAIDALSALAQEHRLRIFRMLAKLAPEGLAAGEIAARLKVSPSALSFHLAHMERARLLRATRDSRHIIYSVDVAGMRSLLGFLSDDCCGGRPELCGGLPALTREACS